MKEIEKYIRLSNKNPIPVFFNIHALPYHALINENLSDGFSVLNYIFNNFTINILILVFQETKNMVKMFKWL